MLNLNGTTYEHSVFHSRTPSDPWDFSFVVLYCLPVATVAQDSEQQVVVSWIC